MTLMILITVAALTWYILGTRRAWYDNDGLVMMIFVALAVWGIGSYLVDVPSIMETAANVAATIEGSK